MRSTIAKPEVDKLGKRAAAYVYARAIKTSSGWRVYEDGASPAVGRTIRKKWGTPQDGFWYVPEPMVGYDLSPNAGDECVYCPQHSKGRKGGCELYWGDEWGGPLPRCHICNVEIEGLEEVP